MRWIVGLATVTLSACGQHTFINIFDASATRTADDHVTVVATLECEAVGPTDCAAAREYCVTATWRRPSRTADGGVGASDAGFLGEVADSSKACKSDVLARGAKTELTIVSTKAISKDEPTAITLSIQSASGGRNDLPDAKVPLLSP